MYKVSSRSTLPDKYTTLRGVDSSVAVEELFGSNFVSPNGPTTALYYQGPVANRKSCTSDYILKMIHEILNSTTIQCVLISRAILKDQYAGSGRCYACQIAIYPLLKFETDQESCAYMDPFAQHTKFSEINNAVYAHLLSRE